jgi:hypothetical protein
VGAGAAALARRRAVSRHLAELADTLVASADERLAPAGLDMADHFLLVARRLAEVEMTLAVLHQPGPSDDGPRPARAGGASYAAMEAALAFWGLAIRLRARLTGVHGGRAAEQLRARLLEVAGGVDADAEETSRELLVEVARSLVLIAPVVEVAEHEDYARSRGVRFDPLIEQLIDAVVNLIRIATSVQEDPRLS